jgi:hypothetical protein
MSAAINPEIPISNMGLNKTAPLRAWPSAPLIAVGKITAKLVPNATLIAVVGSTPNEVSRKNWMGTIIKPPPTPKSPDANPTSAPVRSNTLKYNIKSIVTPNIIIQLNFNSIIKL